MRVEGLDELIEMVDQMPEKGTEELLKAMTKATLHLQRAIKINAPVGVAGHLRRSIAREVVMGANGVEGHVFADNSVPYAICVEEGTAPHWAPLEPLRRWALKKLPGVTEKNAIGVARAIQRKIASRGTKGQFFFEKSWISEKPMIESFFDQAISRVVGT